MSDTECSLESISERREQKDENEVNPFPAPKECEDEMNSESSASEIELEIEDDDITGDIPQVASSEKKITSTNQQHLNILLVGLEGKILVHIRSV